VGIAVDRLRARKRGGGLNKSVCNGFRFALYNEPSATERGRAGQKLTTRKHGEIDMTTNAIKVINQIDSIARGRGCEVEQVAISIDKREASVIFFHTDREVYSAHSYGWWDTEDLPNHTYWGSYDLTLDSARRIWAEKSRRFMEGY
jgi:hypothetical protein